MKLSTSEKYGDGSKLCLTTILEGINIHKPASKIYFRYARGWTSRIHGIIGTLLDMEKNAKKLEDLEKKYGEHSTPNGF